MNGIRWFSTYWLFSPSLVLLQNSSACLMNVFLVISDQGGVPLNFPSTHSVTHTHSLNSLLLPFASLLCTHTHTNLSVVWYLDDCWNNMVCLYVCVCVSKCCASHGKLQKKKKKVHVHITDAFYNDMLLCVFLSFTADIWDCMFNHMPSCGWTNVNPLHVSPRVFVCVCVTVKERERVCVHVHVCAADVLCSALFPRLAGLCCCSLVQTFLATCFSVCKDKPRLHPFNLSIAAPMPRP